MALKIRLARGGAKKRPFYQIVVADARAPRDGRFVEKVGTYNPMLPQDNQDRVHLNVDRIKHWLSVGAQPTNRVALFLAKAQIIEMLPLPMMTLKSQPKAKAQERLKVAEEARKEAEEARKAGEEEARKAEEERKTGEEEARKAEEERKTGEEEARKAEEERKTGEEEARKVEEERKAGEEEPKATTEEVEKSIPVQPESAAEAPAKTTITGETEVIPEVSGEALTQVPAQEGGTETVPEIPGEGPIGVPSEGQTEIVPRTRG